MYAFVQKEILGSSKCAFDEPDISDALRAAVNFNLLVVYRRYVVDI